MSEKVVVSRSKLTSIADAIRIKTETTDTLMLDEMPSAIQSIKGGVSIEEIAQKTLTECSSDKVTKVGDYAFYDIRTLKVLNVPNAESVGTGAFTRCTGLTSISLPKCKTIAAQAFASCNGVKTFNAPVLETIGQGALNSMVAMSEFNAPLLKTVDTQVFYFCSSLAKADFLQLESIGQHGFNNTKMTTLIIRSSSVCTLVNTNAFLNSPIVRGEGYIYVPKSLVDSYKSATNWTTYANQIRAIEDYPDITGG